MTELPTTFGKYYLTEKLATGGMAEIYLAKIIGPGGFEKPLVIKQIHPKLSGNRHFVDLFVAEAKTLVTLAHGNIVPVYELGVVDDTYFIAMEYIDGPTLYRLTERMAGRDAVMEPAVAAWIAARILDGLDYAHRKGEGVIHRDLSPRNVMLSRDGEVKLVDFGIAVTLGDGGEDDAARSASAAPVNPAASIPGPTGSFPYMSPEQVRREALTGQTDLFSVGVLAWEMLAGRRLFARPDADATLDAVLHAPIPAPSTVRPEVPAKLDEVVMRALERDRGARWQSAGDMIAALNKYLYSLDETPGAREVAALVARFCPPETRRQPTHVETLASSAVAEPGEPAPGEPAPAGPRTAVIPRDGAARGRPQRHKTFATNVDMKEVLDRATPLLGVEAIGDEPAPSASDAESASPASAESASSASAEPAPNVAAQLSRPPSRGLLVLVGLGGLALAAGSVYVFFTGRERVLHAGRDAAIADAELLAPADAPFDPVIDAPGIVEPPLDAGIDAPIEVRPDAAIRRIDPTPRTTPDAGIDAVKRGTATLRIGAIPWGEIYIDGKPSGRTPRELSVSAGHHTVEIVFPAVTPPRKQTFAIDLATGETKPLEADFSN
jgi:tRNA A-37 threonylcarbamoyl transferase component Bud32